MITSKSDALVSIVTVCYNAEQCIESTIKSVISQNYGQMQYIVIDGKSTDNTLQIIQKYSSQISLVVSEPDNGIYDAMNKAISLAEGEWILFMNAGDRFSNNQVLSTIFSNHSYDEYGVIYGNSQMYERNQLKSIKPNPFFEETRIARGKGICHQSMFTRTYHAKKFPFNLKYLVSADYAMMYDLYYVQKVKFHYIDLDISIFDAYGYSSKFLELAIYEDFCITYPHIHLSRRVFDFCRGLKHLLNKVGITH